MMRSIIYYRGKTIGGIYDNRFMVKSAKAVWDYMLEITYALPYAGDKEILLRAVQTVGNLWLVYAWLCMTSLLHQIRKRKNNKSFSRVLLELLIKYNIELLACLSFLSLLA